MIKQKIVYIISDIDKGLAFEWLHQSFKSKYQLRFILLGKKETQLFEYLILHKCEVIQIECQSILNVAAFFKVFWQLFHFRPQIVHTHLIKANLIGLTTAWLLKTKKRIYTRHHALVHHREHKKGLWMDKWCNFIATDIISISQNTSHILTDLEKVPERKIRLIHHGFNLGYFKKTRTEDVESLRKKWKIPLGQHPVIGVVARYQSWKGIQFIIPAFQRIKELYPQAHLILANAQGGFVHAIHELLLKLPKDSFTEIPFEEDVASMFQLFDIYIHTPIDAQSEAFGQTYVEALASMVPSVFTLSGVAPEFIVHEKNALVCSFQDTEEIFKNMLRLLTEKELCERLKETGVETVQPFDLPFMTTKLDSLYSLN
jgi:glycosyltransferase involved in cell wall biosynthesis